MTAAATGRGRIIKAATLIQPWATLMAIGAKRIETRSWYTSYRGPVAIHAGKKFDEFLADSNPFRPVLRAAGYCTEAAYSLPRGAVVAVGRLEACLRMPVGVSRDWVRSISSAPHEFDFGLYEPGRFAWVFTDIVRLPEPIPARGALGLWEWEEPEISVYPQCRINPAPAGARCAGCAAGVVQP